MRSNAAHSMPKLHCVFSLSVKNFGSCKKCTIKDGICCKSWATQFASMVCAVLVPSSSPSQKKYAKEDGFAVWSGSVLDRNADRTLLPQPGPPLIQRSVGELFGWFHDWKRSSCKSHSHVRSCLLCRRTSTRSFWSVEDDGNDWRHLTWSSGTVCIMLAEQSALNAQ